MSKNNDEYIPDPWKKIEQLTRENAELREHKAYFDGMVTLTELRNLQAEIAELREQLKDAGMRGASLALKAYQADLAHYKTHKSQLTFALEEIANLQDRWPNWDYQDLYTVSRDTANNALEAAKNA